MFAGILDVVVMAADVQHGFDDRIVGQRGVHSCLGEHGLHGCSRGIAQPHWAAR
jgi:hypothetical protein